MSQINLISDFDRIASLTYTKILCCYTERLNLEQDIKLIGFQMHEETNVDIAILFSWKYGWENHVNIKQLLCVIRFCFPLFWWLIK